MNVLHCTKCDETLCHCEFQKTSKGKPYKCCTLCTVPKVELVKTARVYRDNLKAAESSIQKLSSECRRITELYDDARGQRDQFKDSYERMKIVSISGANKLTDKIKMMTQDKQRDAETIEQLNAEISKLRLNADQHHMRVKISDLNAKNIELQEANDALQAEIKRLKRADKRAKKKFNKHNDNNAPPPSYAECMR